jgi:hypothetical protein
LVLFIRMGASASADVDDHDCERQSFQLIESDLAFVEVDAIFA